MSSSGGRSILISNILFSGSEEYLLLRPPIIGSAYGGCVMPRKARVVDRETFSNARVSRIVLPSSLRDVRGLTFEMEEKISIETPGCSGCFLCLGGLIYGSPVPPSLVKGPFVCPRKVRLQIPCRCVRACRGSPI